MKKRWILLLLVVVAAVWGFNDRRMLAMHLFAFNQDGPPPLTDAVDEGPNVEWYDDYFTIELVAPYTWAIGEPRYSQQNYSYLIVGSHRAILFDAGPGIRDIRAVAESLTARPITFIPSHTHYDHVGNNTTFDRVAIVDVPATRARSSGMSFTPDEEHNLGFMEGFAAPTWRVAEWLTPGEIIDLGGRTLEVFFTPGHTDDSVSLFDQNNDILFSGDYLYPGPLYAFLPTSSMSDYLKAAGPLVDRLPDDTIFRGAHRDAPPGAPTLEYDDLSDLYDALLKIRNRELDGEGDWPKAYPVNDNMWILAEPRMLQDWE